MSGSSSSDSVLQSILRELSSEFHGFLVQRGHHLSSDFASKKLHAKTRDFKTGDVVLPKGCIKLNEAESVEFLASVEKSCKDIVSRIYQDKHSLLAVHLDRPVFYKSVLKEVNEKTSRFGHSRENCQGIVLLRKSAHSAEGEKLSLQEFRCGILQDHVKTLLEAQGYRVFLLDHQVEAAEKVRKTCDELTLKAVKKLKPFASVAQKPSDIPSKSEVDDQHRAGDSTFIGTAEDDIVVELKEIIRQNSLELGSTGYDKNLDRVKAVTCQGTVTDPLKEAMQLDAQIFHALEGECSPVIGCVHLVPQAKSFKNQQVLLLYQAASKNPVKQSQITVGPVNVKTGESHSLEDTENITAEFQRLRFDQIKKASEMRLGHMGDAEVKSTLSNLTKATINIDVLQNAAHVPLHLDLSCEEGVETRTGAFVMYNTARLQTLHTNFLQQVEQGMYPPLPSVDDIDFSLLREEEEWELVFLYIARFPELLSQSVDVVVPSEGKLSAKIHTHKVTNFLVSFSKCLSSYYSRYHILGEGDSHLLPKMYARLHLMKAAHQVLLNGLELIGVKALDYL